MPESVLEARGREIAEALGGHWSRGKGLCRCPAHDDRSPSLGLRVGQRAILVHCFAGCTRGAVLAALAQRGIATRSLFDGRGGRIAPDMRPAGPDAGALRLWRAAVPLAGTPAEAYLRSRGLDAPSADLRFLARTPLGPRGRTLWQPALLAAVRVDAGVIAVQRTFLTGDAAIAPMARPKRGLGAFGLGAVRLCPPEAGCLGLAEGVESALSAQRLSGLPCWATLGNARFGTVAIPQSVTHLHLFLDGDAGGDLGEIRSLAAYARAGRTIVAHRPPAPFDDWNDALRVRLAQPVPA